MEQVFKGQSLIACVTKPYNEQDLLKAMASVGILTGPAGRG
jgi:hypothetical protein